MPNFSVCKKVQNLTSQVRTPPEQPFSENTNFCQKVILMREFAEIFYRVTIGDKSFPSEKQLCQNFLTVKKIMDRTLAFFHEFLGSVEKIGKSEARTFSTKYFFSKDPSRGICSRKKYFSKIVGVSYFFMLDENGIFRHFFHHIIDAVRSGPFILSPSKCFFELFFRWTKFIIHTFQKLK